MAHHAIRAGQRVFSPGQLAKAASRHTSTVWRAIQRGELPATHIGPYCYITERDAQLYIARCMEQRRRHE